MKNCLKLIIYLMTGHNQSHPHEGPSNSLSSLCLQEDGVACRKVLHRVGRGQNR